MENERNSGEKWKIKDDNRRNNSKLEESTLFGLNGDHIGSHSVAYSHFTYKRYLLHVLYVQW